jgi:type VI secretion system protein ImpG
MRLPAVRPSSSRLGFGADEGMLPYSHRSFIGYRLLQEYFQLPEKFCFVDLVNLEALRTGRFDYEARVIFYLDEPPVLDQPIKADHLRLGCTPAVNLFQKTAEPITLDHVHTEYWVEPDRRNRKATEVYSIDKVTSVATGQQAVEYLPFYSFKHSTDRALQQAFWHATRRSSEQRDNPGTEVFLSLINLDFRPTAPATEKLVVQVTCTNRDVPGALPFGDPRGDFDLEGAAPVKSVNVLVKPTRTQRPPMRESLQWRLISQLSLNYLSVVSEGADGEPEVLQEILRLYDFTDRPEIQKKITGLASINSRPVMRRIRSKSGSGFARGIEATLEFDEAQFIGSGMYLFSSVLEKFLGLYVSINSFSELVAVSQQRGVLKRWPPRSGEQVLL